MSKINKKTKRHQRTLVKETNVVVSDNPTQHLGICNSGLVNGLTEETIFDEFSTFGEIENIVLIPGKSCSFVTFKKMEKAVQAFEKCNGTLNIAQDCKPIYLTYVENLPELADSAREYDKLPKGLEIIPNFVNLEEELILVNLVDFNQESCDKTMKHRRVKHFGYEFRYDINNVDLKSPLDAKIPQECDFLWSKRDFKSSSFTDFVPDQLTVNCYEPGQGIPPHIDTHSAFEDPFMCLSLSSDIIMDFRSEKQHFCVLLPRRSLAIISGECRYNWTHGITPRKYDVIRSKSGCCSALMRKTRISYTFRKVRLGPCSCDFKSKCDSFLSNGAQKVQIKDATAIKLEQTHVHDVYQNIAGHFSETRHKPWPNVEDFLNSFTPGDIIVDVGCGNGKYLGVNPNTCSIGCDRSLGLLQVCRNRGFQAFNCDCLYIPVKNNSADGAISIAVIHHLATEERRLQALKELTRILRPKGRALIYVWAKDQNKNKEKSNYIKQNHKNAKSEILKSDTNIEKKTVVNGEVVLPVHTNRTEFKFQDNLVPWKLKNNEIEKNKVENTFLRFYHVFEERELENMCLEIGNIKVVKSYYDQGNHCIILEKK